MSTTHQSEPRQRNWPTRRELVVGIPAALIMLALVAWARDVPIDEWPWLLLGGVALGVLYEILIARFGRGPWSIFFIGFALGAVACGAIIGTGTLSLDLFLPILIFSCYAGAVTLLNSRSA